MDFYTKLRTDSTFRNWHTIFALTLNLPFFSFFHTHVMRLLAIVMCKICENETNMRCAPWYMESHINIHPHTACMWVNNTFQIKFYRIQYTHSCASKARAGARAQAQHRHVFMTGILTRYALTPCFAYVMSTMLLKTYKYNHSKMLTFI